MPKGQEPYRRQGVQTGRSVRRAVTVRGEVRFTGTKAGKQMPLGRTKTTSLIDLATKTHDGTVPLAGIEALSDEEIVARLTAVRGIGRWTAEMFLMFRLRRPDVLPVDDLGVRKGFMQTYAERITPDQLTAPCPGLGAL